MSHASLLLDVAEGAVMVRWVHFSYVADVLFFPSRCRHTRCLSDWSSDVCSSDLLAHSAEGFPAPVPEFGDSFRDELRCRLALARARLFHVLILEVPDIFHLQDIGG